MSEEEYRISNIMEDAPAEEAQARIALKQSGEMAQEEIVRQALKEAADEEKRQPVYPPGYRVNCAPWHRIPGEQNTVQHGIQVEHEPIRRLGNEEGGVRTEDGAEDRRRTVPV